jgi:hypothetical protein
MLNLTTRTQKFIRLGTTLALSATLFLSAPAGAADYPPPEAPPPANDYTESKPPQPDYTDPAYKDDAAPIVFQAAGPDAKPIQSTVDAFRATLGEPDNGNGPGPLAEGRREINWDGGGANDTTTPPVTPFDVFLDSRGAQFTTEGEGLSQAPPAGGPQGGLAVLFNNPTYGDIFSTFSPLRLFTPVGSNIT